MKGSSKMHQRMRIATVVLVGTCGPTFGQADFAENFDSNGTNLSNLVAKGWSFRNQSDPAEGPAFFDGLYYEPHEGTGFLEAWSALSTGQFGGELSNWAVLPDIPGLQAGDTLSFYNRGWLSPGVEYALEVRYSPSGGSSTGTGPASVGDFTQLLASIVPTPDGYTRYDVVIPGDGRIAFRDFSAWIPNFPSLTAQIEIDTLSVGEPAGQPCDVPVPAAGETVFWTLAGSPYTVCNDIVIPAGGTVIVEPGVTVIVEEGRQLFVHGDIIAHGTPAAPITVIGDDYFVFEPAIDITGSFDMQYVEVMSRLQSRDGGDIVAVDCVIPEGGVIATNPLVFSSKAMYVGVERCAFTGGSLSAVGNVLLADTTLDGGAASVGGYVRIENVVVDGTPLWVEKSQGSQPMLIDDVSITGASSSGGLVLYGTNFFVGDNATIQDCLYPVEFGFGEAGLLAGSTVPATGNTVNAIKANEGVAGNRLVWAGLPTPYIVQGNAASSGTLTILPGATVQYTAGSGSSFVGGTLDARGTPDAPIVFEARGAAPWQGLAWVSNKTVTTLQNVVVRDASIGVQADDTQVALFDSVLTDSALGGSATTFGRLTMRKVRVFDNELGARVSGQFSSGSIDADGDTGVNSFVGNIVGVDANGGNIDAERAWWGDPSGPMHPNNPGGSGDKAEDILFDRVTPWETVAPDNSDHLPIIEAEENFFLVHTGDRVHIRWKAQDDGEIVSQRIEYTPQAFNPPPVTIAELDANVRAFEWDVPIVEPSSNNGPAVIRIVGVDDQGQESWDEITFQVPYQQDWDVPTLDVTISTDVATCGEQVEVCWTPGLSADAYLFLEGEGTPIWLGGGPGCLPIGLGAPDSSTDLARVGVRYTYGAGGRMSWHFSEYFSIRPDDRIGDEPPQVELISPEPGESFIGGTVIPVAWTAADDEALRSFSVQASYDGGVTWSFITRDLPAGSQSFAWHLPASDGIDDVRVRVVAADRRFQSSSDSSGSISILPGDACVADVNADGALNILDFVAFQNAFQAGDAAADVNGDGVLNILDFVAFQGIFQAGC